MKKCILLVRVSTKVQDFDEQEKQLYQMAINDGYKKDDIIPICEKESGIKLAEEERAGLNRMKELIESEPSIDCVYCWEVSRIARKKKINFSVLDYLQTHKKQLIIREPSIRLFNEDGTINDGAETVFTLFSQIAESEMRTKQARWKRTKDAKRKDGYYVGGFVAYGYKVNPETKKLYYDEESKVKEMFDLFLTGKYSYGTLAREMQEQGLFEGLSLETARRNVGFILTNVAYAGLPSVDNHRKVSVVNGNIYPAIVTLDMIEKVRVIAEGNTCKSKHSYSTYYFGKGLIRCPHCGKLMVAKKNSNTYFCQGCNNPMWVGINIVDSCLWTAAVPLYAMRVLQSNDKQRSDYSAQISLSEKKINVSESNIKKYQERIDALFDRYYVDGRGSKEKTDSAISELEGRIKTEQENIIRFKKEIRTAKTLLEETYRKSEYVSIENIKSITDDAKRYEIIHEVFDYVTLERDPDFKYRYKVLLYLPNQDEPITYHIDSKYLKVYDGEGNEIEDAYEQRFIKKFSYMTKEYVREHNKQWNETHKEYNRIRMKAYRDRKKAERLLNSK